MIRRAVSKSGDVTIYTGDVREALRAMPERSVQCVVTSPPYYGLRDYDVPPSTWDDGWEGVSDWSRTL